MCAEIFLTGRTLSTLADVRSEGWLVPDHVVESDWSDNVCLCGVDVEALLDANGLVWEWDPFGYSVDRPDLD